MTIPHYWNPQQVEGLLDALAALGLRRARVAALIMWRSGLRVGETVSLEWRDIDVTAGTLLVRRGKGGRGRTVPLHPDLASLFANWPTSYGPRDLVVGLTRKTALRHLRVGIEHAGLDEESPGTGRQRAGAHSLRHSAARHWLTTAVSMAPAISTSPACRGSQPGIGRSVDRVLSVTLLNRSFCVPSHQSPFLPEGVEVRQGGDLTS